MSTQLCEQERVHSEHPAERRQPEHRWVAAALVDMGDGANPRAEHAARTGRHVLLARTRVEVLEVYCTRCRVGYESHNAMLPCSGAAGPD